MGPAEPPALVGLVASAVLAGSILPAQSEVVLAGAAQTPFPLFLAPVTLAKAGRYAVIAAALAP